jgi:lysozyme family protein
MDFNAAIKIIFAHEGGYVNDPQDPGGETKYGISKRAHPTVDIKNLTPEIAASIYHQNYFEPLNLGLLVNDELALHLFDMAVNAGLRPAVRLLQQILVLDPDGQLGPITAKAANQYPDPGKLVEHYKQARIDFYTARAKENPVLRKYLGGWINRVNSTKLI